MKYYEPNLKPTMLNSILIFILHPIPLIEQVNIVTGLIIVVAFFLILLILGIRKSYKLRAENDRLSDTKEHEIDEKNKEYKDFTEGHLYDDN